MRGKVALLVGGAAGYVLGARAGRERYEQIKRQAQGMMRNPTVREKASQAQDYAMHKAPEVKQRVADTASHVAHRSDSGRARDTTPPSETYPNADRPTGDLG